MKIKIFITCLIGYFFCGGLAAQGFQVGTYNLRYANAGDSLQGNGWGQRFPVIVNMLLFHDFQLFGIQEGLESQLQDLEKALPGYARIGVGRDDGNQAGEHSAIFYRTDLFDLLDHGDFWLSPITDKPNRAWDAALPRICTWGKFREKQTKFVFYYFNLHMDHKGVKARAESAKLILAKIRALPAQTPVILTGDFNVDQHNESHTLLDESGILHDTYELSPVKLSTNGTFNNFNPNGFTNSRIDHIFVTDDFKVKRYGILTDTYRTANGTDEHGRPVYQARTPSDHFPVLVALTHQ
ncbi:MAG TPA: endonuclease/exonuclease/phosphatase family protein [Sediminibacterium sp.]|nr:endonuclease/exonuclease/phosphatase family protein [Sediminibacterium sp.]